MKTDFLRALLHYYITYIIIIMDFEPDGNQDTNTYTKK